MFRQCIESNRPGSWVSAAASFVAVGVLLLAFGLGKAGQAAGLPLSDAVITVMTLAAALPSASNVSLLAERFGADTARIARIILFTTVAAFGSFALVAGWMTG